MSSGCCWDSKLPVQFQQVKNLQDLNIWRSCHFLKDLTPISAWEQMSKAKDVFWVLVATGLWRCCQEYILLTKNWLLNEKIDLYRNKVMEVFYTTLRTWPQVLNENIERPKSKMRFKLLFPVFFQEVEELTNWTQSLDPKLPWPFVLVRSSKSWLIS